MAWKGDQEATGQVVVGTRQWVRRKHQPEAYLGNEPQPQPLEEEKQRQQRPKPRWRRRWTSF